jgi:hypothetical protein
VFWDREVVGSRGLFGEDAHFVDEVGDELASSYVEYLYWLSRSFEGGAFANSVAGGAVSVDQVPSSS